MNFQEFLLRFHIVLNKQQLDAVQVVDGPVLLLAVPGSGKTTVLVTRLGYMIYCCGIAPESILMLTYTRAAAKDMSERFAAIFGPEYTSRMHFRTINSICDRIIRHYASQIDGRRPFQLESNEKALSGMIAAIFQETEKTYPTENDIHNVRTMITYIKNMQLPRDGLERLNENLDFDIARIYDRYQKSMRDSRKMDYDDQMVYALNILKRSPQTLAFFQNQFPYICVDEAQDTSKIQHSIISMLAGKKDNLFMVGDEDQSIYGFRAAYPEALLNFSQEHAHARVLLMEENFRSTQSIVHAADRFISMNLFRHEKHMITNRSNGTDIRNIKVKSRSAQYSYLLKVAQGPGRGGEVVGSAASTAVLYRNNESAIPLIDLLERNGVPYRTRNQDLLFFTHRTIQDIHNIIAFAYNGMDTEAFMQIYYKIGLRITKQEAANACRNSFEKQIPILMALEKYGSLGSYKLSRVRAARTNFQNMVTEPAGKAFGRILKGLEYEEYLERSGMSDEKIKILRIVSFREDSLKSLDERLHWLKERIQSKENDPGCPFILSTIHSSKGLEYDRVYLIDCMDGVFPSEIPDRPKSLKNPKQGQVDQKGDKEDLSDWRLYEEERRMFYVGVTRARTSLNVFTVQNCRHTLIDELLGKVPSGKQEREMKKEKLDSRPVRKRTDEEYAEFCRNLGCGIPVVHKRLGEGVIADVNDQSVQIYFEDTGEKTFNLRILFENDLLELRS